MAPDAGVFDCDVFDYDVIDRPLLVHASPKVLDHAFLFELFIPVRRVGLYLLGFEIIPQLRGFCQEVGAVEFGLCKYAKNDKRTSPFDRRGNSVGRGFDSRTGDRAIGPEALEVVRRFKRR